MVSRLEEHPNLDAILGVLAQVPQIRDEHLTALALAWRDTPQHAAARDHALSPDSPLVLEVLTAFEAVSDLFADDLDGDQPYVSLDPTVTATALRAVRDALAAAYASPVLSPAEYRLLSRPWQQVFGGVATAEPDLGPRSAQLKALLATLPRLAARCHDPGGRALFDAVAARARDAGPDRDLALHSAFQAAVLTSRRRSWVLVRRSGAEGLFRRCPSCGSAPDQDAEAAAVVAACLDAACALLVADTLPDETTDLLTAPAGGLIPSQRGGSTGAGQAPPRH